MNYFETFEDYVRENCDLKGDFSLSATYYLDGGTLYLEQAEWFHVGPCQDPWISEFLCDPSMVHVVDAMIVYDGELDEEVFDYEAEPLEVELLDVALYDEEPVDAAPMERKGHVDIVFWGNRWVIEDRTFQNCENIRGVELPEIVLKIGDEAFAGCVNLTDLVIPDTVKHIGKDAFRGVPHITYHGPLESEDNWGALSRN